MTDSEVVKSANVWLGAETGLLKSVDLIKKVATNHFNRENYGKEQEICKMCWKNPNKSEIFTGHKSGIIREFNIESNSFGKSFSIPKFQVNKENIVGLNKTDTAFVTCTSKGHLMLWEPENEETIVNIEVGDKTLCMSYNHETQLIATGGRNNLMKIWDANSPEKPVFRAKNVKLNWLQLEVPIWVTNIQFIPNSDKVLTTTGTQNIRVYDPKCGARRPILETEYGEYPITAANISERKPNQVFIGNTHGEVASFDIRKFKHQLRGFKSFAGSVRSIMCHPTHPYFFSCGLDRHLRVHHEERSKVVHKVYLKSRLNCLLVTDANIEEEIKLSPQKRKVEEVDEEEENMWSEMDKLNDSDSDIDSYESSSEESDHTENYRHNNKKSKKK